MANLSKERRDRMMAKLEELKAIHSDDESIMALNEIENALKEKKFGLVFEEHSEMVDEMLRENIPVFTADPERRICKDENSPWNFIIEGDNLQALYLLEKTHKGKVDCIYIDPPYNTGAHDWKYNNNYVGVDDGYRHSLWLSMMHNRLVIAKNLLTETGVMIVAIDDYEVSRLMVLIEDIFPDYDVCPVIVNHHPQGGAADNISRTHEYALFVVPKGKKIVKGNVTEGVEESWSLTRGGTDRRNLRQGRPNSFYAIYVDKDTYEVKGVGPHLDVDTPYDYKAPDGCFALYPVGKDGTERVWRYERESMQQHIKDGDIVCTAKKTLNVVKHRDVKYSPVVSVWTDGRYNAGTFGTSLLYDIFGQQNRFSYPKSLYTVEDCIKFSIHGKKNATIVDFFSGSGTTGHAVALINSEDGGNRKFIMVTNNEISEAEEIAFAKRGVHKGDEEWEEKGIAKFITYPRIKCVIDGVDINGNPLRGTYLGSNRPMSEGFQENVKYFKCEWVPRIPKEENLADLLLEHIREMIELEHAIEIDSKTYIVILEEAEADCLEKNWNHYSDLRGIFLSRNVLLTTKQRRLFNTIEMHTIPDYYFDIEMKEVGESW